MAAPETVEWPRWRRFIRAVAIGVSKGITGTATVDKFAGPHLDFTRVDILIGGAVFGFLQAMETFLLTDTAP